MLMTIQEQMKEEILTAIKGGQDFESVKDNSGEWIDGYLPVYNSEILKEWQVMPSEYDDRGAIELGYDGDANIVRQMSLDLYLYYSDLFNEVLNEIESEQEEGEE